MWQTFRNYFLTAQLTVGPVMALRMTDLGWPWMLLGFLATIPLVAPLAWWRAAYVTKHPESALPIKPRWIRTIIIGTVGFIALAAIAVALKPPG